MHKVGVGGREDAGEASFLIVPKKEVKQESDSLSGELVMPETLYLCNIFSV